MSSAALVEKMGTSDKKFGDKFGDKKVEKK